MVGEINHLFVSIQLFWWVNSVGFQTSASAGSSNNCARHSGSLKRSKRFLPPRGELLVQVFAKPIIIIFISVQARPATRFLGLEAAGTVNDDTNKREIV
jgi:hypothetical protein